MGAPMMICWYLKPRASKAWGRLQRREAETKYVSARLRWRLRFYGWAYFLYQESIPMAIYEQKHVNTNKYQSTHRVLGTHNRDTTILDCVDVWLRPVKAHGSREFDLKETTHSVTTVFACTLTMLVCYTHTHTAATNSICKTACAFTVYICHTLTHTRGKKKIAWNTHARARAHTHTHTHRVASNSICKTILPQNPCRHHSCPGIPYTYTHKHTHIHRGSIILPMEHHLPQKPCRHRNHGRPEIPYTYTCARAHTHTQGASTYQLRIIFLRAPAGIIVAPEFHTHTHAHTHTHIVRTHLTNGASSSSEPL